MDRIQLKVNQTALLWDKNDLSAQYTFFSTDSNVLTVTDQGYIAGVASGIAAVLISPLEGEKKPITFILFAISNHSFLYSNSTNDNFNLATLDAFVSQGFSNPTRGNFNVSWRNLRMDPLVVEDVPYPITHFLLALMPERPGAEQQVKLIEKDDFAAAFELVPNGLYTLSIRTASKQPTQVFISPEQALVRLEVPIYM